MVKVLETGHLIVHLCPINYLSHVEWPVRCDWSAILCFLIFQFNIEICLISSPTEIMFTAFC